MFTGDVQNGGTDAVITMCVFGSSGYTSDIVLEKNGERFERGREDLMKVCIGNLERLQIYGVFPQNLKIEKIWTNLLFGPVETEFD